MLDAGGFDASPVSSAWSLMARIFSALRGDMPASSAFGGPGRLPGLPAGSRWPNPRRQFASVPEPSGLLTITLGIGGVGLAICYRRSKKRPGPRGLIGR